MLPAWAGTREGDLAVGDGDDDRGRGWRRWIRAHLRGDLPLAAATIVAALISFCAASIAVLSNAWHLDQVYVPVNVSLELDDSTDVDSSSEDQALWIRGRMVARNPGAKTAHVLPSIYVARGRRFELTEPRSERLFLSRLRRAFNGSDKAIELTRAVLEDSPETVAGGTILAGWSLAPQQEAYHDIAFVVPVDRYDLVEVTIQMPVADEFSDIDVEWLEDERGRFEPIFRRGNGEPPSAGATPGETAWYDDIKLDVVSTTARVALQSPRRAPRQAGTP